LFGSQGQGDGDTLIEGDLLGVALGGGVTLGVTGTLLLGVRLGVTLTVREGLTGVAVGVVVTEGLTRGLLLGVSERLTGVAVGVVVTEGLTRGLLLGVTEGLTVRVGVREGDAGIVGESERLTEGKVG
jgi:hypothetical protein